MDIKAVITKHSLDLSKVDLSLVRRDINEAISSVNYGTTEKHVLEQLSLACSDKAFIHTQWALLAGRIQIEIIHNEVPKLFSESTLKLQPILNNEYFNFVIEHSNSLNEMIRKDNDYNFDIFSVSTLRKSYLAHLKINDKSIIMETPQYMYLRVASYLHFPDLKSIEETYISLSNGDYAHATPTLFNSGLKKPQLSSCFLLCVSDTMNSITKAWHDQAIISMNSGGLGCDYSQIRHSEIGQHGISRGIVPWLKITNEILKTVDQAGRRKGSGTIYLRDFHIDIPEFIELRDEGPEETRAKDLFLGLMISDLFMRRVERDEMWSLFCPNRAKGLADKYGAEFESAYIQFEKDKIYSSQIKARDLWSNILKMQIKKGMPFILFMDACNSKSNQKHSGVIRCSNLCCEITEVTNDQEVASCTLGSLSLNKCVEI